MFLSCEIHYCPVNSFPTNPTSVGMRDPKKPDTAHRSTHPHCWKHTGSCYNASQFTSGFCYCGSSRSDFRPQSCGAASQQFHLLLKTSLEQSDAGSCSTLNLSERPFEVRSCVCRRRSSRNYHGRNCSSCMTTR